MVEGRIDLEFEAVVGGEWEVEEAGFFLGAAADVVDDVGCVVGGLAVGDDHDVREFARDGAGDEVTGEVVGFVGAGGEGVALAIEVGAEVGDAAVVDVGVGFGEVPLLGIFGEVAGHVFVEELLEVLVEGGTEGADDDVGADAAVEGDVAVGVGDFGVGGVVGEGFADLGAGGDDEGEGGGGCGGAGGGGLGDGAGDDGRRCRGGGGGRIGVGAGGEEEEEGERAKDKG
jgi:hypothetical protein